MLWCLSLIQGINKCFATSPRVQCSNRWDVGHVQAIKILALCMVQTLWDEGPEPVLYCSLFYIICIVVDYLTLSLGIKLIPKIDRSTSIVHSGVMCNPICQTSIQEEWMLIRTRKLLLLLWQKSMWSLWNGHSVTSISVRVFSRFILHKLSEPSISTAISADLYIFNTTRFRISFTWWNSEPTPF